VIRENCRVTVVEIAANWPLVLVLIHAVVDDELELTKCTVDGYPNT
jgi:hypothetical protein